ncbi:COG4705 family protein [Streptomyces lavendulae]|uniref:hypothetical protein n=1 Tax=Streptomyces lavendulae TaxID=1914 RepID=UPI0036E173D1
MPSVPNVLLFWIAFVLTRPLGAIAVDFLTKPTAKGGLDLGTAGSSAALLAVRQVLPVVSTRSIVYSAVDPSTRL